MDRRSFLKSGMGALSFAVLSRGASAAGTEMEAGAPVDLGPVIKDRVLRAGSAVGGRTAAFFIDDAIWFLRDISRSRPMSLFAHPFLGGLKEAHDRWGLKVQLNLFYRTDFFYGMDEFTLADMTDAYKGEWKDNADWIKFGMHSLQEFPDYPFVNSSYDDVRKVSEMIFGEVARFADSGMCSKAVVPHWGPVSREGCHALADLGMKVVWCSNGPRYAYTGDASSLPYGHSFRIEQSRKPETALFWRGGGNAAISSSICAYNHLPADETEETAGTYLSVYDRETRLHYKKFCVGPCLNLFARDAIVPIFEKVRGRDFICFADHEQYFFKDYFAYQPDYMEKVHISAKWLHDDGRRFVFIEDTVD